MIWFIRISYGYLIRLLTWLYHFHNLIKNYSKIWIKYQIISYNYNIIINFNNMKKTNTNNTLNKYSMAAKRYTKYIAI